MKSWHWCIIIAIVAYFVGANFPMVANTVTSKVTSAIS